MTEFEFIPENSMQDESGETTRNKDTDYRAEWEKKYHKEYPIPPGWNGKVDVEIGPGDGFFQRFRGLVGKDLLDTAIILIDIRNNIPDVILESLNKEFGHVYLLNGDGVEALKDLEPKTVDRIDVNNVFGSQSGAINIDPENFAQAVKYALAPRGEVNITETITPDYFDPNTSKKLQEALQNALGEGSTETITNPEDPAFDAFRLSMRERESYSIRGKAPETTENSRTINLEKQQLTGVIEASRGVDPHDIGTSSPENNPYYEEDRLYVISELKRLGGWKKEIPSEIISGGDLKEGENDYAVRRAFQAQLTAQLGLAQESGVIKNGEVAEVVQGLKDYYRLTKVPNPDGPVRTTPEEIEYAMAVAGLLHDHAVNDKSDLTNKIQEVKEYKNKVLNKIYDNIEQRGVSTANANLNGTDLGQLEWLKNEGRAEVDKETSVLAPVPREKLREGGKLMNEVSLIPKENPFVQSDIHRQLSNDKHIFGENFLSIINNQNLSDAELNLVKKSMVDVCHNAESRFNIKNMVYENLSEIRKGSISSNFIETLDSMTVDEWRYVLTKHHEAVSPLVAESNKILGESLDDVIDKIKSIKPSGNNSELWFPDSEVIQQRISKLNFRISDSILVPDHAAALYYHHPERSPESDIVIKATSNRVDLAHSLAHEIGHAVLTPGTSKLINEVQAEYIATCYLAGRPISIKEFIKLTDIMNLQLDQSAIVKTMLDSLSRENAQTFLNAMLQSSIDNPKKYEFQKIADKLLGAGMWDTISDYANNASERNVWGLLSSAKDSEELLTNISDRISSINRLNELFSNIENGYNIPSEEVRQEILQLMTDVGYYDSDLSERVLSQLDTEIPENPTAELSEDDKLALEGLREAWNSSNKTPEDIEMIRSQAEFFGLDPALIDPAFASEITPPTPEPPQVPKVVAVINQQKIEDQLKKMGVSDKDIEAMRNGTHPSLQPSQEPQTGVTQKLEPHIISDADLLASLLSNTANTGETTKLNRENQEGPFVPQSTMEIVNTFREWLNTNPSPNEYNLLDWVVNYGLENGLMFDKTESGEIYIKPDIQAGIGNPGLRSVRDIFNSYYELPLPKGIIAEGEDGVPKLAVDPRLLSQITSDYGSISDIGLLMAGIIQTAGMQRGELDSSFSPTSIAAAIEMFAILGADVVNPDDIRWLNTQLSHPKIVSSDHLKDWDKRVYLPSAEDVQIINDLRKEIIGKQEPVSTEATEVVDNSLSNSSLPKLERGSPISHFSLQDALNDNIDALRRNPNNYIYTKVGDNGAVLTIPYRTVGMDILNINGNDRPTIVVEGQTLTIKPGSDNIAVYVNGERVSSTDPIDLSTNPFESPQISITSGNMTYELVMAGYEFPSDLGDNLDLAKKQYDAARVRDEVLPIYDVHGSLAYEAQVGFKTQAAINRQRQQAVPEPTSEDPENLVKRKLTPKDLRALHRTQQAMLKKEIKDEIKNEKYALDAMSPEERAQAIAARNINAAHNISNVTHVIDNGVIRNNGEENEDPFAGMNKPGFVPDAIKKVLKALKDVAIGDPEAAALIRQELREQRAAERARANEERHVARAEWLAEQAAERARANEERHAARAEWLRQRANERNGLTSDSGVTGSFQEGQTQGQHGETIIIRSSGEENTRAQSRSGDTTSGGTRVGRGRGPVRSEGSTDRADWDTHWPHNQTGNWGYGSDKASRRQDADTGSVPRGSRSGNGRTSGNDIYYDPYGDSYSTAPVTPDSSINNGNPDAVPHNALGNRGQGAPYAFEIKRPPNRPPQEPPSPVKIELPSPPPEAVSEEHFFGWLDRVRGMQEEIGSNLPKSANEDLIDLAVRYRSSGVTEGELTAYEQQLSRIPREVVPTELPPGAKRSGGIARSFTPPAELGKNIDNALNKLEKD